MSTSSSSTSNSRHVNFESSGNRNVVPIMRDNRTFEQQRREMLTDLEGRGQQQQQPQHRFGAGDGNQLIEQTSERRTVTSRSGSDMKPRLTGGTAGFDDEFDSGISDWAGATRKRWDEDMERIRRDMVSLQPNDSFGSDPFGSDPFGSSAFGSDPFGRGFSGRDMIADMEREMDSRRQGSPFGSGSSNRRPGGGGNYESSSTSTSSSRKTTTTSSGQKGPVTHTDLEESAKSSHTIDGVTTGTSSHAKSSDTTKGQQQQRLLAGATPGALVATGTTEKTGDSITLLRNAYEVGQDGHVHFKVRFDAKDFDPEDIKVATVDKQLTVNAKKSVKTEAGMSTREFSRTIDLPMSIDHGNFKCNLTEDGMLILDAPVNAPEYHAMTFDQDNNLGIRPQAEGRLTQSKLTRQGTSGHSIRDATSGRIYHLEVPIDPEYTSDELCVRTDATHIIVTGRKDIAKDPRSNTTIMPTNFSKSFEVPESIDLMSVTAQMEGHTLIIEAPLQH